MDGAAVSIRLRRSTPAHDAYTVRVFDRRFAALATARPADARRWVATTRWLHAGHLHRARLVVGLGVQWTPTGRPLHGALPVPATLQLCVGHRCLVFHLAHADAVPEALRRFLADPRVTFVGSGAVNDRRMLWAHYGLDVARGRELRAIAGMGNASLEDMADRFLGYPGIHKPRDVAMSVWHAPRLSPDQVQYASVDAYLAFRLGVVLCCPAAEPARQPVLRRAPPPAQYQQRVPVLVRPPPPVLVRRQAPPAQGAPVLVRCQVPPVQQRGPAVVRQAPPAQRAPVVVRPAPRVEWSPRAFAGGSVPAVVGGLIESYSETDYDDGVGVAITSSKVVGGLIESDMDSYTDYDDDVGGTATHGLPIRVYASDSDGSSYGFEHVRLGGFTDDEEDEDDGSVSYSGTGSLGADGVDSNGDDEEDEEGCNVVDQQEDEEGCIVDDQQEDEEGCNGDDQEDEEGYNGDDQEDEEGYNGDDLVDEEGCNGGDLEDEEGCNGDDLEDNEDEFEEFYLL